jgi:hypothetical protein
LQTFFARLTQSPARPPEPDPDPDPPEDDDDLDSVRFIASGIRVDGVSGRDERVEHGPVVPIAPAMLQAREQPSDSIDKQFWTDLDRLEALLRATGKIETSDEEFLCRMCRKKCKSNVYLLQHVWEQHRDQLARFESRFVNLVC